MNVSSHESVVLMYQSDSEFCGEILLGRLRDKRHHVVEVGLAPYLAVRALEMDVSHGWSLHPFVQGLHLACEWAA